MRKLIKKGLIINILGVLLMIESFFMFLSLGVAFIYREGDLLAFLYAAIITLTTGALLFLSTRKSERNITKREGYIIVSLVWIVFSFFGSLPFLFSGAIPDFTDAFFETMSGFTTTGSSILNDIIC